MSKFIALVTNGDIYFLGETLDEVFNLASDGGWDIDDLSFHNLGNEVEVEMKVIPVMSQQISVKKGK